MPAFLKTPADEARWKKAKDAANKGHSESEGDAYWAIVNSIYQKMSKAKEELEKARPKMSDEYDPNEDPYESEGDPDHEGMREFDPEDEGSDADEWLKENDPRYGKDEHEEYSPDEDPEEHQQTIDEDMGKEPQTAESAQSGSRFIQPTPEDITHYRKYTRPWEQRAREVQRLQADPSKNPELAHLGNIIEARNKSHKSRQEEYQALINSKEYQDADPIAQMEMDDKFEQDWKKQNPQHLTSAMKEHHAADTQGLAGKDIHAANKHAQIQNIISGGSQAPETFSTEAGLQHAGGTKGEEGTQGTIVQDPAASFAMGNQDFLKQYAQDYAAKGKRPKNIDDMMQYDEGSKRDIGRILGSGQTKDPRFEKFFEHYYPLIGMSAARTIKRLGLDPKSPDVDMSMLHEAGMHGLMQAVNDYEHNNPGKASFATHAGNKIRGLQMTAMKNIDQIPAEVRRAQKQFQAKGGAANMLSNSSHPKAPDMQDRLKRIDAAKATHTGKQVVRRTGAAAQPKPITSPIAIPKIENMDEGEE